MVDPLEFTADTTNEVPFSGRVNAEFAAGNAGAAPKPPLSARLAKFWQTHQIAIVVTVAATTVFAIFGR